MFETTRLKLTAFYLLIIMVISVLFSFAIYSRIDAELKRFERVQVRIQSENENLSITSSNLVRRYGRPAPEVLEEARTRLIVTLGFINLAILALAGGAGYFLAGRTLKPIKDTLDEQNRFITDASHELRTPLTSLRSEIEVALREKDLSQKDAVKILESNLQEVVSLQTLSDNLLELAQDGNTLNTSEMIDISTKDLIEKSIKKVEPLAKKKQILIENKIKDRNVIGVPDRLTEVFVILLDNAIKYSPENSKVKIVSSERKNQTIISVVNSGKGIYEDDLALIFDRFYRSNKSGSASSEKGYGLGLSIAKKIVEAHDGQIFAESILNKETKFSVLLKTA